MGTPSVLRRAGSDGPLIHDQNDDYRDHQHDWINRSSEHDGLLHPTEAESKQNEDESDTLRAATRPVAPKSIQGQTSVVGGADLII